MSVKVYHSQCYVHLQVWLSKKALSCTAKHLYVYQHRNARSQPLFTYETYRTVCAICCCCKLREPSVRFPAPALSAILLSVLRVLFCGLMHQLMQLSADAKLIRISLSLCSRLFLSVQTKRLTMASVCKSTKCCSCQHL